MKYIIKNKLKLLTSTLIIFTLIFNFVTQQTPAFSTKLTEISAPSAILVDENTGAVMYSKNPDEKRFCASITKIMTVLLVMESIENKKIKLEDKVTVSEHASSIGGSDIWLKENESMTVDDLLKATMVASANDAATALAEYIFGTEEKFVNEMNKRANELGMNNTVFKNCNGLDEDGHVSSARDISVMSRELLKHKDILKYTSIWMDYLRNGETQIVNTNKLLKSFEGITGLKTGTTDDAGCCICASAKRGDISLIAVILGAKTSKDRFKDAANLLNYGFDNFISVMPKIDESALIPVKVKKGMKSTLKIKVLDVKKILIPKDRKKEIKSTLELKREIIAPITKGQKIGKLIYKLKDKNLVEFYVVADENIEKINFKDMLKVILKELFRC